MATGTTPAACERSRLLCRIRVDETISGPPPKDVYEIRIWRLIEGVFCFLKDVSLYQVRRYIKFIIIWQSIFCTVRFIPILLGYSYLSTIPVFLLVRRTRSLHASGTRLFST